MVRYIVISISGLRQDIYEINHKGKLNKSVIIFSILLVDLVSNL